MNIQIDTSPLPIKRLIDRRGQCYGRLTIIAYDHFIRGSGAWWRCVCVCGNETVVAFSNLRSGHTTSCGCYQREFTGNRARTHGKTTTSEYHIWVSMKRRCYSSSAEMYPNYGGRGITVCEQWRNSFENFYADMGTRPSPQHSIDRIDNDGPYSPDNCRWATSVEQGNNTRVNHHITYQGVTQTLTEWARQLDIPYDTLKRRIYTGMPVEKAFSTRRFGYPRRQPGYHKKPRQLPS